MVADFNGDGVLDLLESGDFYAGNGDGTFKARVTGHGGGTIIGDVNGDGFLDTATTVYGQFKDVIYLGKGDGTFTTSATLATGLNTRGIASGDLNGDGFLDLVDIENWTNTTGVFLGNGNGTFQARQAIANGTGPTGLLLQDINADGKLDILTSEPSLDRTTIFFGKGDGTFGSRSTIAGGFYALSAADLNRDGILDLMTTDSITNNLSIHLGIGKDGVNPLLTFSLRNVAEARQSMSLFSDKLDLLTSQRGTIGAFQSRLETATNLLQSETENFKAAESQIRDVDIASSSAELVRRTTIQQAAASILAQANQQPSLTLKLLQP